MVRTLSRLDHPVIFDAENSSLTTFRARPSVPAGVAPRTMLRPASTARPPRFLVPWEGKYSDWWGSLRTLFTRVRLSPWRESIDLFRDTPVAPFRFAGGSLSLALLLHFVAILALPFLLAYSQSSEVVSYAADEEPQRIYYYQVPKHDPFEKLPRITPAGDGWATRSRSVAGYAAEDRQHYIGAENRHRLEAGSSGQ